MSVQLASHIKGPANLGSTAPLGDQQVFSASPSELYGDCNRICISIPTRIRICSPFVFRSTVHLGVVIWGPNDLESGTWRPSGDLNLNPNSHWNCVHRVSIAVVVENDANDNQCGREAEYMQTCGS